MIFKRSRVALVAYDHCPPDAAHTCDECGRTIPKEVVLREHREEWASYIENWSGAVGWAPPTVESIVAALRLPSPPFGVATSERPGNGDA